MGTELSETFVLFCNGTWTDDALLVALTEINTWDVTKKKLFLLGFNNNASFRQGIIENSTLVYGWAMYQTTDLAPLKVISPWKTTYPNLVVVLKSMMDGAMQKRFYTNYSTNAEILQQLNADPTRVSVWREGQSWTDAVLLTTLQTIQSWTSEEKRKAFITAFTTNTAFKTAILAAPTLVACWEHYPTTVVASLSAVCGWKTTYPNVYTPLKDFVDNELRDSFHTHFNANPTALTLLNTRTTLIDIWKSVRFLKAQARSTDFLDWFEKIKSSTVPFPRLRDHIFIGHPTTGNNGVQGVHHQSAITYTGVGTPVAGNIQVVGAEIPIDTNGIYKQNVEIFNGTVWKPKIGNGGVSTFFPKTWTKDRILEEIAWARTRVTIANWQPPVSTTSNSYIVQMTKGDKITLFIGTQVSICPATVTGDLISAFPTQ